MRLTHTHTDTHALFDTAMAKRNGRARMSTAIEVAMDHVAIAAVNSLFESPPFAVALHPRKGYHRRTRALL